MPALTRVTNKRTIVFVGRFDPRNGVKHMIGAFTALRRTRSDVRLVIVGDGPELARLRREAGPSVQFLGAVAHEELPRLYARASFFLLPGEEDFGIAPVEAQSAGRPVLALGRGGALETVIRGKTGLFFEEASVESLLDGVCAMDAFAPQADRDLIHAQAERFAAPRFIAEMREALHRIP